ncbi:unnamed protein product, partial [Vitis vinifera]
MKKRLVSAFMDSANPSPVRVLIRSPSSPTPTTSSPSPIPSAPPPDPPPSSSLQPRPSENVVVVGFIGRRPDDVSHLMNRILDLNAFGSGNLEKGLCIEKEEVKGWFESRRISYYHDEEKGILFLQYCSTGCPAMEGFLQTDWGFDSALEEREFGDLQGMLFMFAVCHVIIYIQEGSRFDTQVLKKFRVLQAAKHSLAPFVRSRTTPTSISTSRPPSSRPSLSATSSNNPSPGRGGGSSNRNTSSISLMSGLGSYASLFPGQCNPVTLFVFLDDFSDVLNPTSNVDESTDNSFNQSSSLSNLARPSLPTKGSGSVVVLARPGSKSEGGFRKKLQSSLEAQIRFLIKKCRTLTGSETHSASRGGGVSSSAPLFSLDASRAVSLLDRSTNQKGESLEFATALVEDVLNGKATSDSLLLESHSQNANKEDILSVKEFIYRQSDILRGRGGLVTNTNSGSAAGVGMIEGITTKGADPLDIAVSWLESGKELNMKFSTLWCERALPAAKEVYLKDLPALYPTSLHEAHLEKTLHAFRSMVKGPAVQLFTKKLEDECTSIWRSGRQLCDAVSLTGKPCMHQRHDIETGGSLLGTAVKPHSSGFVFLHACACGRSRKLRADPFDFETANITSNCFPDCDRFLPALQLPKMIDAGPIQPLSWNLIRVGGTKYYEPSKGLLQSGFHATQKFLLKWIIFLEKHRIQNDKESWCFSINGGHGKGHRHSNGMAATATNKLRNFDKSKETLANGSQHLDALVQFSGLGREQNQTSIGSSTLPNSVKDLGESMQSVNLDDGGGAFSLLNRNLPIYMNCPHCKFSKNKKDLSNVKFAGAISQLQRIFLVTPPFPVILATCPVVQFEASCLPPSIPDREKQLQFSLGCRVILPPESFLTLRLPFVYGVQLEDRSLLPLNPFDHQPELTAWITKGTTLQIMSKGSNLDEQFGT